MLDKIELVNEILRNIVFAVNINNKVQNLTLNKRTQYKFYVRPLSTTRSVHIRQFLCFLFATSLKMVVLALILSPKS